MPRRHIIISGTGRAGTTFLVQLLTELGLDTGFPKDQAIDTNSRAGMELDLRDPNSPYVVKSPWLCDYLDELLEASDVVVEHAIIPVRDLYAAAQSRRHVASTAPEDPAGVPGGLWHTKNPQDQETILTGQLYKLIYALARHDVPVSLLFFPRFVNDPEYLFGKLNFLLGDIEYNAFRKAFQTVSRPEFVHDFKHNTPSHSDEKPEK
jgi:hypothetical protein